MAMFVYVSGGASKRSDHKGKHIVIFQEKQTTEIVCELIEALLFREEMAMSSLSGKHSNAHKYKESQLCPAKVKAICGELLVV